MKKLNSSKTKSQRLLDKATKKGLPLRHLEEKSKKYYDDAGKFIGVSHYVGGGDADFARFIAS